MRNDKKHWTALLPDVGFDPWPAVLPRAVDEPALPLAIGLADDLMLRLPEARWPALRKALGKYCASANYLGALATDGAMRFDVEGNPVAPVSEADRLSACVWLLARSLNKADGPTKAKVATEAKALVERARAVVGKNGRPILSLKKAG